MDDKALSESVQDYRVTTLSTISFGKYDQGIDLPMAQEIFHPHVLTYLQTERTLLLYAQSNLFTIIVLQNSSFLHFTIR